MIKKRLFSLLVLTFAVFGASFFAVAQNDENAPRTDETKHATEENGKPNVSKIIFGHISDAHDWHLFSIKHAGAEATHVTLPLPVIIFSPTHGFSIFMSSSLGELHPDPNDNTLEISEGNGTYHLKRSLMKEYVVADDNTPLYDFSITKNVLSMLISVVLLLVVITKAGKKYSKADSAGKAPRGFQNFLEVVVIFLRDEVGKPCIGPKYTKYMPLLLTIFFFIWINNLFGLLPGGANFTGNIAVTSCLALLSFIIILASSKKHFWSHLFNPPGVPGWMKPMLVLIEILSLFIKPMALMIRLFANIMAGHIVILALICIIFIFAFLNTYVGAGFSVVSLAFTIFMFFLELLVGAIQAFIFANLTAVFIGQSLEDPHDEHVPNEGHVHA